MASVPKICADAHVAPASMAPKKASSDMSALAGETQSRTTRKERRNRHRPRRESLPSLSSSMKPKAYSSLSLLDPRKRTVKPVATGR